jgi:hypothetical protein
LVKKEVAMVEKPAIEGGKATGERTDFPGLNKNVE